MADLISEGERCRWEFHYPYRKYGYLPSRATARTELLRPASYHGTRHRLRLWYHGSLLTLNMLVLPHVMAKLLSKPGSRLDPYGVPPVTVSGRNR